MVSIYQLFGFQLYHMQQEKYRGKSNLCSVPKNEILNSTALFFLFLKKFRAKCNLCESHLALLRTIYFPIAPFELYSVFGKLQVNGIHKCNINPLLHQTEYYTYVIFLQILYFHQLI